MTRTTRPASPYAETDADGNLILDGYIEAGGDPSKLKLNNNLTDITTNEYALLVINGIWHHRAGLLSYPIPIAGGINLELAYLIDTITQNPVTRAFGYMLTYPLVFDDYLDPAELPYLLETQEASDRYVFSCGMVNDGVALAWNDVSAYTKDLFEELQSDGNTPQLYTDYMRVASSGGALQDLSHMVGTDGKHTGAELVGEMSIPTHDFTSGALAADIGITTYALGFGYFPIMSLGYDASVSTVNYIYSTSDTTNGGAKDSGIPLSTGKIAYKLTWSYVSGFDYTYSIEINGVVIDSGTASYTSDPTDTVFYVTSRIQGSGTVGVFEIFDYGFLISYTE